MKHIKARTAVALSLLTLAGLTACSSPSQIAADDPNRQKHSEANSSFDLCMSIGRPLGCEDFRFATESGSESEAGTAMVGGRSMRFSIYPSENVMADVIAGSSGANRYGQNLDLVAGGNWTVTFRISDSEGHDLANQVAVRLGGQWIDMADFQ